MKLVVDPSLGRLAKWLRLLGFDTVVQALPPTPARLPPPVPGTFYLSRRAAWGQSSREDILVLRTNDPEGQLAEVGRLLPWDRKQTVPFRRCGECNDPLVPVARETVAGSVPDHVFYTQTQFFQCQRCHRIYWPGSHVTRMVAKIREIFPDRERPRPPRGQFRKGEHHGH